MILQNFCFARPQAGPRPTLPPGGRFVDVTRRNHVRRDCAASRRLPVAHALPGSGAALPAKGSNQ